MEDITDAIFKRTKNLCKDFELKYLGDYHDLHVQSDTLLLADIFQKFRNKLIQTYEYDPYHFLSPPGLNR